MHVLLLFVAVVQQPTPMAVHTVTVSTGDFCRNPAKLGKVRSSRIIGDGIACGVRTGKLPLLNVSTIYFM